MNKIIIWFLISIFIFLFVNQIYLYFKQSNIKEGITNKETVDNNDYKIDVYKNKNDIDKLQKKTNEIKKEIDILQENLNKNNDGIQKIDNAFK
jgi:cell division protein FtsB